MKRVAFFQQGFAIFGLVMVVATITLVGFVAFRFLDAQDNTEIADNRPAQASSVAAIESEQDIDSVTAELDSTELDSIDADLDAEFSF